MNSNLNDIAADSLVNLIRPNEGRVSRQIFSDPDIYRLELERIFSRTWAYIGHESELKSPGDFLTNTIGEDPVIASRDAKGDIHVMLNACSHRGRMVCPVDRGNARSFTCAYHGWTYASDGSLAGVPRADTVYHGELDRSKFGLRKVPRVETHNGLIFANWDADAMPLKEFLGDDLLWYMDLPFKGALGELEVVGPVMKYRIKTNWKIASENFAGDDYHVLHTHRSGFEIGFLPDYDTLGDYIAYFGHGHGMGDIPKPGRALQNDLGLAQFIGPEAVDYVNQYQARLKAVASPEQASVHGLGEGNIFPNCSWIKFGCFHVLGLFQWHPKGPNEVEVRQTVFFDTAAPQVVKDFARSQMSQENSAAGIFGQDDGENFEQITASAHGFIASHQEFDYTMGLGHEGEIQEPGYRGQLGPHFSEQNHRNYYRYYLELMTNAGLSDG
jgi:dibenzofuran dioxygenase alpha subunit